MKGFFTVLFMVVPVVAAADAGRDPRVGMVGGRVAPVPQAKVAVMSKNQITTPDVSLSTNLERSPSIKDDSGKGGAAMPKEPEKDKRDAERMACLNNNIGVGNTFVWASRYSNTNNYATMQEDVENPDNNVCFVKVDLKSSDSRINLSDVQSRYFQWGETINCGSWVDEEMLTQRILDAKKKGRTWATVGGAVGGAAIGVGSMELFGNKLIGGKVEGQESLQGTALLRSQLLTFKNKQDSRYTTFKTKLSALQQACDDLKDVGESLPDECEEFESLLDI